MPGKYRKAYVFTFNYSVWMILFCDTVCCMLHIRAVKQTIYDISRHGRNINISHTCFHRRKQLLGLRQLGVRFLADSNSWNVNGTPNPRILRQMLKSTEPAGF